MTTREKTIGESRGKRARGGKTMTSATRSSGVGQKEKRRIQGAGARRTQHLQPSTCSRQHNTWQDPSHDVWPIRGWQDKHCAEPAWRAIQR
jgi:hypothetical protein